MIVKNAFEDVEVSVVVSVYENVSNFEWTLSSIQMQTECSFEVVVIDDGNTIQDSVLLESLCSRYENVRLYKNKKNLGLTKSLIKGCVLARAPFIARIDNGDLMIPRERLRLQLDVLNDTGCIICGGQIEAVEMDTGAVFNPKKNQDYVTLIKMNQNNGVRALFNHVTVMFSKDLYFESGGYNEALRVGQDAELWPRIIALGHGVVINQVLAIAPMWRNSISVRGNNMQILGKIKRIIQSSDNKNLRYRIRVVWLIFVEILKLVIPSAYRNKLKLRKSSDFVNYRYGKNVILKDIYEFYYF